MKKLVFFLIGLIMLSFSTLSVIGQFHEEFYNKPAIYQIDNYEKNLKITLDFYTAWENETISSNGWKWYQEVLETHFMTFIINGWLYALSYDPNTNNSYDEKDYSASINNNYNFAIKRNVWLYKKNTKVKGDWELANINPILISAITGGISGDGISFQSKKNGKGQYNDMLIKSKAYKNVVFILCRENIVCNGSNNPINLLVILTPISQPDGSLNFSIGKYLNSRLFPMRFIGTSANGKTLLTIDNNGKPRKINTYLGGTYHGNLLSTKEVSFDGDYGWKL